ncbi:MAG: hypothetical protein H0W86_00890 [Armatimonadetes bacterium]|nr:hypothetical protein [Armatimonadota bacterium]
MTSVETLEGFDKPEVNLESKTLTGLVRADKLSIQQIVRAVKKAGGQYDARLVIAAGAKPSAEALDRFRSQAGKLGVRAVSEPDADHKLLVTFDLNKETRLDDILKAAVESGIDLTITSDINN